MFILDKALKQWSEEIASSGAFTASQRDELEDHLYFLVEDRKTRGDSDESAFNFALKQLGQSKILATEYARNSSLASLVEPFINNSLLTRTLGTLVLVGGLYHVFYCLRLLLPALLLPMGESFRPAYSILFIFFLWSVYKGALMLTGKKGNSAGLLVFFLVQIPVLYLSEFRYDFFSGLALTLNLGDAPALLGFGLGGKLYVDVGEARQYAFVGINLYALVICMLLGARIWAKRMLIRDSD